MFLKNPMRRASSTFTLLILVALVLTLYSNSVQAALQLHCDFVKVLKNGSIWDGEFNETFNDEFTTTAKEFGDFSKVLEVTNNKCDFNGQSYKLTTKPNTYECVIFGRGAPDLGSSFVVLSKDDMITLSIDRYSGKMTQEFAT